MNVFHLRLRSEKFDDDDDDDDDNNNNSNNNNGLIFDCVQMNDAVVHLHTFSNNNIA